VQYVTDQSQKAGRKTWPRDVAALYEPKIVRLFSWALCVCRCVRVCVADRDMRRSG